MMIDFVSAAINLTQSLTTISILVGLMGSFGLVFSFVRYNNYRGTVQLQNDNIAALEKRLQILSSDLEIAKANQLDYVKNIGILEGQVHIYKDLQLEKMAHAMSDISKTNKQILDTLRTSADILAIEARDGGTLVHTEPTKPVTVKLEE